MSLPILKKLFQLKIDSPNRSLIFAGLAKALIINVDYLIINVYNKPYGLIRLDYKYYEIDSPQGSDDYMKLSYLSKHSTSINNPAVIIDFNKYLHMLTEEDSKLFLTLYKEIKDAIR